MGPQSDSAVNSPGANLGRCGSLHRPSFQIAKTYFPGGIEARVRHGSPVKISREGR